MCSQSAPHCSMNFASDARFAKSDDSIEGAILGCGSIRCNSSSFPPPMVGRSIDRWISSSFDPHLLLSQTQKKRKAKKNPSEDGWLLQKPLAPENLVIGKPSGPKESLIRNLGKMISSKKNSSSRQISEQFLFFSQEFSSSSSSSSLLLLVGFQYEKKGLGFSDLKTCLSKLGEFFFFFL
jgi:hypothetical protein